MKKYSQVFIFAVCLCVLLFNLSCKKNPVGPPPDITVALTLTDANCTEVYLQLTIGAALGSRTLTLMRDTIQVLSMSGATGQTTLTDTNLLPNHTYNYTASLNSNLTAHVQATTMDTTSHNFTFQTFTLGDGTGSSTLYDIAIINDSLAYAVGAIYQNGSVYNLAKWNGMEWTLKKLYYYDKSYGSIIPLYSSNGIFIINPTDIWLSSGSIFHWNGSDTLADFSFNRLTLNNNSATVIKLWGKGSSDLYGVGGAGTIVHYNGTSWTKIESGTSLNFYDIWRGKNESTNQTEIIAIASQLDVNSGNSIVQLSTTTATAIAGNEISWGINGIWFVPNRHYYIVGGGIYEKHLLSYPVWKNNASSFYASTKVRGNAINDVLVVGAYGELLHYNGVTWKDFLSQTGIDGAYGGLAVKGNTVIAVGQKDANAVILMGTHN